MPKDKKLTKAAMFTAIARFLEDAPANMDATPEGFDPEEFLNDAIAALNHEVELLNKKRSSGGTPTKTQLENITLKQSIVEDVLTTDGLTATEVANSLDVTVQKASALLRQLVTDGFVERVTSGKKVKFVNKG